jgi:hypothetical protein
MNSAKLKTLLAKSGFCLWNGEPHAPPGAVVDWSCTYDTELLKLVELIVMDCAVRAVGGPQGYSDYYKGRQDAAKLILQNWNIQD